MNELKKRKVVLALVAGLVLGTGTSFWYFGRDSGSAVRKTGNIGPVVRREPAVTSNKASEQERRVRVAQEKATVKVRATREATRKKEPTRRTRRYNKRTVKIKKKDNAA